MNKAFQITNYKTHQWVNCFPKTFLNQYNCWSTEYLKCSLFVKWSTTSPLSPWGSRDEPGGLGDRLFSCTDLINTPECARSLQKRPSFWAQRKIVGYQTGQCLCLREAEIARFKNKMGAVAFIIRYLTAHNTASVNFKILRNCSCCLNIHLHFWNIKNIGLPFRSKHLT